MSVTEKRAKALGPDRLGGGAISSKWVACAGGGGVSSATGESHPVAYNDAALADADYVWVFSEGFTSANLSSVTMGGQAAQESYTTVLRHSTENAATQQVFALFNNTSNQLGTSGNIMFNRLAQSSGMFSAVVWVGLKFQHTAFSANTLALPAKAGQLWVPKDADNGVCLTFIGGYAASIGTTAIEGGESLATGAGGNGWARAVFVSNPIPVFRYSTGVANPHGKHRIVNLPAL